MATKIIMPKLGNTVESSVILAWKVKPGDTVNKDTILCEIETDKATMDVPAGEEGTVLALLQKEGDDVPVLAPIAVVGKPGETWNEGPEQSPAAESAGVSPKSPEPVRQSSEASTIAAPPSAQPASSGVAHQAVSPRARQTLSQLGVGLDAVAEGSGPGGRVIERDVIAASQRIAASGSVAETRANLASDANATGASAQTAAGATAPAAPMSSLARAATFETGPEFEAVPLAGIRKRIAGRMRESLGTTAQYTEHSSADAERLLALRARLKGNKNPDVAAITIGDLVLAAVLKVLPEFPEFNAHLEEGALKLYRPVHLGVAVDTPRGLMVPVVRNAQALTLTGISKEVKRLAQTCQTGSAAPDELSGSTFTVTNLGAFGVEQFTPVINAPETAILGVCAIRPALAQTEKGIETRMRIGLSLTSDHQVIDGAYAARFLKRLTEIIADIDIMFI